MQEDEITRNKQKNAFLDYICPSAKRRSGNPGAMITRATKSQWSQDFSAVSKVYETSTNQISCSFHKGIPSYEVTKSQNVLSGQNLSLYQLFLQHSFFPLPIFYWNYNRY